MTKIRRVKYKSKEQNSAWCNFETLHMAWNTGITFFNDYFSMISEAKYIKNIMNKESKYLFLSKCVDYY